jgi:hypothetical protein
MATQPKPITTDYQLFRHLFTHGRCPTCKVVYAWRPTRNTRLADLPACPEDFSLLNRTALGNLKGTVVVQVRNPAWNTKAAADETARKAARLAAYKAAQKASAAQ